MMDPARLGQSVPLVQGGAPDWRPSRLLRALQVIGKRWVYVLPWPAGMFLALFIRFIAWLSGAGWSADAGMVTAGICVFAAFVFLFALLTEVEG